MLSTFHPSPYNINGRLITYPNLSIMSFLYLFDLFIALLGFVGDQILFFLLAMVVFVEFICNFKPFLAMTKESSSGSCH